MAELNEAVTMVNEAARVADIAASGHEPDDATKRSQAIAASWSGLAERLRMIRDGRQFPSAG